MAAAGCGGDADESVDRTTVEEGDPDRDIVEPRPVTLSGEVRTAISPDAFLLGGEDGDQPVLMVKPEPDDSIAEEVEPATG